MSMKVSLPDDMAADATPEKIVDDEIRDFNDWFQTLGNGPLGPFEKAPLKTYFAWKLGLAKPR